MLHAPFLLTLLDTSRAPSPSVGIEKCAASWMLCRWGWQIDSGVAEKPTVCVLSFEETVLNMKSACFRKGLVPVVLKAH
jgi:hypothetical protein